LRSRDLIQAARILAQAGGGRPTGACLRRATSTAYYAMFHHLTQDCANLLIGTSKTLRGNEAWHRVYRSLDHSFAKGQCKNKEILAQFPGPIETFANLFVMMQSKRHEADYDPRAKFSKSGTMNDIALAEKAILDFAAAPVADRCAFCAFVLFRDRKN